MIYNKYVVLIDMPYAFSFEPYAVNLASCQELDPEDDLVLWGGVRRGGTLWNRQFQA